MEANVKSSFHCREARPVSYSLILHSIRKNFRSSWLNVEYVKVDADLKHKTVRDEPKHCFLNSTQLILISIVSAHTVTTQGDSRETPELVSLAQPEASECV